MAAAAAAAAATAVEETDETTTDGCAEHRKFLHPSEFRGRSFRDVITIGIDRKTMGTEFGTGVSAELRCGDNKDEERVYHAEAIFHSGMKRSVDVRLKLTSHHFNRAHSIHCGGKNSSSLTSITGAKTDSDGFVCVNIGGIDTDESTRSIDVMVWSLYEGLPFDLGPGLAEARDRADARVTTLDGVEFKVHVAVMRGTRWPELYKPFWDLGWKSARDDCPVVHWPVSSDAAHKIINAIYYGADHAWKQTPTSGAHAAMWLSVLKFVEERNMKAFVARATELVGACITAESYTMILDDATLHGWTTVLSKLEAYLVEHTGEVLAAITQKPSKRIHQPAAAAAGIAEGDDSIKVTVEPKINIPLVVHTISGLKLSLRYLSHNVWSKTELFDVPHYPGAKCCVLLRRYSESDDDIRVRFACTFAHAPKHFTIMLPELARVNEVGQPTRPGANTPISFSLGEMPFRDINAAPGAMILARSDWVSYDYYLRGNVDTSIEVTTIHMALPPNSIHSVSTQRDESELKRTEYMLGMAKEAKGVDVCFVSTTDTGNKNIAVFAHSVIVASHSEALSDMMFAAAGIVANAAVTQPPPAAAAAASPVSDSIIGRCRNVRLNASSTAIRLMRDALYRDGEILRSELATVDVTEDLLDLVSLCGSLQTAERPSPALKRLQQAAMAAIARGITPDNIAAILIKTKLPEHSAVRPLVDQHVKKNPRALIGAFRRPVTTTGAAAAADTDKKYGGLKRSGKSTADEPAAKRQRVVATVAVASVASLDDQDLPDDDE